MACSGWWKKEQRCISIRNRPSAAHPPRLSYQRVRRSRAHRRSRRSRLTFAKVPPPTLQSASSHRGPDQRAPSPTKPSLPCSLSLVPPGVGAISRTWLEARTRTSAGDPHARSIGTENRLDRGTTLRSSTSTAVSHTDRHAETGRRCASHQRPRIGDLLAVLCLARCRCPSEATAYLCTNSHRGYINLEPARMPKWKG